MKTLVTLVRIFSDMPHMNITHGLLHNDCPKNLLMESYDRYHYSILKIRQGIYGIKYYRITPQADE